MERQSIIFTPSASKELKRGISKTDHDRLFLLMDETTERLCRPLLDECTPLSSATSIVIPATDVNKNLDSLSQVWQAMSQGKGSRRSLLINLGGGMVTDLGGFAASTFKRGIRFINIPTTLLSMVDASVGGKTGINFLGFKNEIGVFQNALEVIIDTRFLRTLDQDNILSGYAEMLKHGLISDTPDWAELLRFDLNDPDLQELSRLLEKNVAVKQRIVLEDPLEQGLRKALNVGHTMGHAFESFAIRKSRPVLHGHAVAWGIVSELYLSAVKMGFPTDKMRQTVNFILEHYGRFAFNCNDYEELYELTTHDKKNTQGFVNFTLLSDIGQIHINQSATKEEIFQSLDFLRDGAA